MQTYVPVIGKTGKPLMPTTHKNANKLIAKGKAVRRFDRGLFFIKLTERQDGYLQQIDDRNTATSFRALDAC